MTKETRVAREEEREATTRFIDFVKTPFRDMTIERVSATVVRIEGTEGDEKGIWLTLIEAIELRDILIEITTPALEANKCERRDAERYRWLREQNWSDGKVTVTRPGSVKLGHDTFSRERLDSVIDEARS